MTLEEYDTWHARYRLNPWGERRLDDRFGLLRQTIVNISGRTRERKAELKEFEMAYISASEQRSQQAAGRAVAPPANDQDFALQVMTGVFPS